MATLVLQAAGAAVLATAAVARPGSALELGAYLGPEEVDFQTQPHTEACNTCIHWDSGACRVVLNANNSQGWCKAYT